MEKKYPCPRNLELRKRMVMLHCCMLFLAMLLPFLGKAQVSSYSFSATSGTYIPITGGTVAALPNNPGNFLNVGNSSIQLGFTFNFNSQTYTECALTCNGAISFGGTPIGEANQGAISLGEGYNGAIAILSSIIQGHPFAPVGEIRYQTLGSPGSRVFILQWSNCRKYHGSANNTERFEMQIQLYETTNVIKLVYGTFTTPQSEYGDVGHEVGLRGYSNADFKNLYVGSNGNWATPVAGVHNQEVAVYSQFFPSIKPVSGQTYTFTPPPPCVNPTAQPTALVFNTSTNNSVSGSFTAASPAPTKYMVVRSTSATPPVPVDNTRYIVGSAALGAGTYVVQNSNALSFNDTGLTIGTMYYYHIFSFNDACTGAPAFRSVSPLSGSKATLCTPPTGLTAVSSTGTTAQISWPSGNAVVEYGPLGFTPGGGTAAGINGTISSVNAASPYTITGLQPSTGYHIYIRQVCPLGGISQNSAVLLSTTTCVPITSFPSTQPFTGYLNTCWYEGTGGTLASGPTITGSSGAAWASGSYLNGGPAPSAAATIRLQGTLNDWLITPFYTVNAGMQLRYKVGMTEGGSYSLPEQPWDPGDYLELVYSSNMINWTVLKTYDAANTPVFSGQTDAVDLSAFSGQSLHFAFRLVRNVANTTVRSDFFVDDFTVEAKPVTVPSCASGLLPVNGAVSVNRNVILKWSAATGTVASYDVYFGTNPTPPFVGNTQSLNFTAPAPLANTQYYWQIVPRNAAGTATGCPIQSFTTGTDYEYCDPTNTSFFQFYGIVNVSLKNLNNSSGISPYTFYNSVTIPTVAQLGTVTLSVTFNDSFHNKGAIWIDYNQNGVFEASEGRQLNGNPQDPNSTITMEIPIDAQTGLTRMRVRGGASNNPLSLSKPCGSTTSGLDETEDYLININPVPADLPDNANLYYPASGTAIHTQYGISVYGHIYEAGLTGNDTQAPGIKAWVGLSPQGQNTNPNTWTTWIPADFQFGYEGYDSYEQSVGYDFPVGTYYYTMRYQLNEGNYYYGGYPDHEWNGTTSTSGVFTVVPYLPNCTTTLSPANGAIDVSPNTTFTWNATSGAAAAIQYQFYIGTSPGAMTLEATVSGTSYSTTLNHATTYYWKVVPIGTDGSAVNCNTVSSFTTHIVPPPIAPYCTPTSGSEIWPITRVTFAGIDNSSSNVVNGSPYMENFTYISTGFVERDKTYPISVKGNTNNQGYAIYFIYFDWNHDGIFDIYEGELVSSYYTDDSNGLDNVAYTASITIPSDAATGSTRMRIKKGYWWSYEEACDEDGPGQVEEYIVQVHCPIYYLDADNDGYGNPAAPLEDCNGMPAGYVANNTDCNDANAGFYPGAVEIPNDGIDGNCNGMGDENMFYPYCKVTSAQTVYTVYSVSLGGIYNSSGYNTNGSPYHENFISMTAQGTQGESLFYSIDANNGAQPTSYIVVWGDWNHDDVFDNTEVVINTSSNSGYTSGTFQVPSNALVGVTRIRIKHTVVADGNLLNPCSGSSGGQYEDYSLNVLVTPCSLTTTWNGTVWSPFEPVADQKVVFEGDFDGTDMTGNTLSACAVTVNSGNVKIGVENTGNDPLNTRVFDINGPVTINGGSLTVESGSALLQVAYSGPNTGSITYKRNAAMRRLDYVYWSSPVNGQNLLDFSDETLTNRFYTLDETANAFASIDPTANDFIDGKGYMIRAPNDFIDAPAAPQLFEGSYTGVPNNGYIYLPITHNNKGYNLVGNPYPSSISAQVFLAHNPGTLYFWTHRNQAGASGANYCSYNTTGGTAAVSGGNAPDGTITGGQGFLLLTATSGTLQFNNYMRTGSTTGTFYRDATERHRYWLNLSSPESELNQMLVGYLDGATMGEDDGIDGALIESGSSISSTINEHNYVIQGRALPFEVMDTVPLNFKAVTAGTFTISIDHTDGLFSDTNNTQGIFLKDNFSGMIHDLKQSAYTFASAEGTFASRFEIVYQSTPLAIDNNLQHTNAIIVYKNNGVININTASEIMTAVMVFDIRGRLLYEKKNINGTTVVLDDLRAENQLLLVQVVLDNGGMVTKKVSY